MNKIISVTLCFAMLSTTGCGFAKNVFRVNPYSAPGPETNGITIETEPPGAAITVDGAYVGDSPVTADIRSTDCVWVGVMNAPGGKRCAPVRVQAQPRGNMGVSYSQEVLINPSTMISKKLFFNMKLEPIHPTQAVQIK